MNFDRNCRIPFGALSFSLLLHLLLVAAWLAGDAALPAPVARPLAATIMVRTTVPMKTAKQVETPAKVAQPARTVAISRPKQPVDKAHNTPPAVEHRSVSSPPAMVARETASDAPSREVPAASAPAIAAAGPAMPAPTGTRAATSAEPAAAHPDAAADSLNRYRQDLAEAVRRFRVYPALARSRGWEGVAELAVSSAPGSPAPLVRLTRSSGYELLDDEAEVMVKRALSTTRLPDDLRTRSFALALPIRFSLRD